MERLETIFDNHEREIELAKIILRPLSEASPKSVNLVDLLINYGSEIKATRTLLWNSKLVDFNCLFLQLNNARYIDLLTSDEEPMSTIVLGITELRMPLDAKDFFVRNYLERPLETN